MATEIDSVTQLLRNMQSYAGKMQDPATGVADEKFAAAHTMKFAAQEFAPTGDNNNETTVSLAEKLQQQRLATALVRKIGDAAHYTGVDSILVDASAKMAAALQDAISASERIDAVESKSFMDDPLGWFKNQIIPDPAYREYEAAASKFNLLSQGIVATSNTLQEVATTIPALKEPLSVAAEKSIVNALDNKLKFDKAQIEVRAHELDADAFNVLWNATAQQAQNYESSMRLAMARHSMDQKDATQEAKELAKQGEDQLMETIGLGYKAFHGVDMPELALNDFKVMLKTGQPLRTEYGKYIQRGQQVLAMDPKDPMLSAYGFTPAEAAENIQALRIKLSPAAQRTLQDVIVPAQQEAIMSPEYKQAKTVQERNEIVNAAVKTYVSNRTKNMDDRDGSNPFLMLPLKAFDDPSTTGAQIVKGTNLWKKVFAEDVKAGKYNKLDHQQIFDAVATAVQAKKITALEAANDLTTITAFSKLINSQARLFGKFGIEPSADYLVRVSLGSTQSSRELQAGIIPGAAGGVASEIASMILPETNVELVNFANTNSVLHAIQKATANTLIKPFKSVPAEKGKGKGAMPK